MNTKLAPSTAMSQIVQATIQLKRELVRVEQQPMQLDDRPAEAQLAQARADIREEVTREFEDQIARERTAMRAQLEAQLVQERATMSAQLEQDRTGMQRAFDAQVKEQTGFIEGQLAREGERNEALQKQLQERRNEVRQLQQAQGELQRQLKLESTRGTQLEQQLKEQKQPVVKSEVVVKAERAESEHARGERESIQALLEDCLRRTDAVARQASPSNDWDCDAGSMQTIPEEAPQTRAFKERRCAR